jgi:hypothetical protein
VVHFVSSLNLKKNLLKGKYCSKELDFFLGKQSVCQSLLFLTKSNKGKWGSLSVFASLLEL